MNRIIVSIGVMLCLLLPSVVLADSADQAYQKARDSYSQLQNSSRKQMYRDQWERIFKQFESVHERFPRTKRGADALYMCGKTISGLYTISRITPDAERAVELFERMAESYPDSTLADDALMQAGRLLEEVLDDKQRAFLAYQRLVSNLPDGDMARLAKPRLKALAEYAPPPEMPAVKEIAKKAAQSSQPLAVTVR